RGGGVGKGQRDVVERVANRPGVERGKAERSNRWAGRTGRRIIRSDARAPWARVVGAAAAAEVAERRIGTDAIDPVGADAEWLVAIHRADDVQAEPDDGIGVRYQRGHRQIDRPAAESEVADVAGDAKEVLAARRCIDTQGVT